MAMKPCSRCKIEKPLDAFSPDKRAASGRQPHCKECHRVAVAAKRKSDPEAHQAYQRAYYEQNRDKVRDWNAGWRDANREKYRAQARATYLRRREKHIEWVKESRRKNPERTREWARGWAARRRTLTKDGVGAAELRAWMKAQTKVCYWCGCRCQDNFHVDHYEPLARGGKHEIDNLVIACGPCNLKKNAKDPLDFAKEVGRLL